MRIPAREVRDPVGLILRSGRRASRNVDPVDTAGVEAWSRGRKSPRWSAEGRGPGRNGITACCHAVSRLASVIEDPVAPCGAPPPPSFGVGTRKRDDPRAQRRAETGGDGKMEETKDDVMMKRARIGRMPNGQRGGPLHSTTVILRCERKRASKDDRPVAWRRTGRRPTDHGFTRRSDLERASRQQPTCDGPRFARAPQGDGHNGMRAA
jgi:hypothetical protein